METNLIEQLNESADGYKYLFYLFDTYYKEMANVCAYVKRNPNKITTV